jgi:hypothetical protein
LSVAKQGLREWLPQAGEQFAGFFVALMRGFDIGAAVRDKRRFDVCSHFTGDAIAGCLF